VLIAKNLDAYKCAIAYHATQPHTTFMQKKGNLSSIATKIKKWVEAATELSSNYTLVCTADYPTHQYQKYVSGGCKFG